MRIDPCPHCGYHINIVSDHGWGCPYGGHKYKRFRRDVRAALELEGGWHVASELVEIVHADSELVALALNDLVQAGLVEAHPASLYHYKIKQRNPK